ncbi:hypothetical protein PBOI14_09770 [Pseudomonas sp. Boi14]|nr:hypothetical protein PBOI14_09770 [Pseudomonas sp. Boi14]
MTGLSAARFGLHQRGEIREGHWADLVLFDPARVRDVADFKEPQRAAQGIDGVWVNGVCSFAQGRANGERHGRFLPGKVICARDLHPLADLLTSITMMALCY